MDGGNETLIQVVKCSKDDNWKCLGLVGRLVLIAGVAQPEMEKRTFGRSGGSNYPLFQATKVKLRRRRASNMDDWKRRNNEFPVLAVVVW